MAKTSDTPGAKQIADKIKDASNILVTVSSDPTVDELSAALGLTAMLNKLGGKHATAIVSGTLPPAITFLEPEKTFENTVDSLRDFIIALDKEKADHLRYKVEGDVVKIFITPYRTTITEKDLDFSQGDYNVELVLALGVKDETSLDKALEAHGRILHDATVVTLSAGSEPSNLGAIDWHDDKASSLSEMLVSLSEAIKSDKPLLDEQVATAFLTGIVAATDRFSNDQTSSKVMTMAAQLMAAGANQQLIAAQLEEAHAIGDDASDDSTNSDGTTSLEEDTRTKIEDAEEPADEKPAAEKPAADGTLSISHEMKGDLDEVAEQVKQKKAGEAVKEAEDELDKVAADVAEKNGREATKTAEDKLDEELKATVGASAQLEPLLGGTLNATTEQAAEDKRHQEDDDRNHTILSHDAPRASVAPSFQSPFNAAAQTDSSEPPSVDPFAAAPDAELSQTKLPEFNAPDQSLPAPIEEPKTDMDAPEEPPADVAPELPPLQYEAQPLPEPSVTPMANDAAVEAAPAQTLAELDAKVRQPHEDALDAVHATFDTPTPEEQPMTPVADIAPLSTEPPVLVPEPVTSAEFAGLPPMPDFSTLPPMPPVVAGSEPEPTFGGQPLGAVSQAELASIFGTHSDAAATPPEAPAPEAAPEATPPTDQPSTDDPGQFKIPGATS